MSLRDLIITTKPRAHYGTDMTHNVYTQFPPYLKRRKKSMSLNRSSRHCIRFHFPLLSIGLKSIGVLLIACMNQLVRSRPVRNSLECIYSTDNARTSRGLLASKGKSGLLYWVKVHIRVTEYRYFKHGRNTLTLTL